MWQAAGLDRARLKSIQRAGTHDHANLHKKRTKKGPTAGYTAPHASTHRITWARLCFNPLRASRPFPPGPPAPAEEKSKLPSFSSRNLGSLRASFPTLTDTDLMRPVPRDRVGMGEGTEGNQAMFTPSRRPCTAEPWQWSHAGDDEEGLIVISQASWLDG